MGLTAEVMSLMGELAASVFNCREASAIVSCLHWIVISSLDKDRPMLVSSTDLTVDETTPSSGLVAVERGGGEAGTPSCFVGVGS